MFSVQPYDSVTYLWWTAIPKYEWEPAPPPAPANADAAASAPGMLDQPPLQLVFKGMQWVLVPITHQRTNPFFDQIADDQADRDRLRGEARKAPVPTPRPEADPS